MRMVFALVVAIFASVAAEAADIQVLTSKDPNLVWKSVTLPAILSRRQGNRGIESIAMSPDERFLYFILQNPLANPDAKAYQQAKNTRLFKLERATGKLLAERAPSGAETPAHRIEWYRLPGSNGGPPDPQSGALTI